MNQSGQQFHANVHLMGSNPLVGPVLSHGDVGNKKNVAYVSFDIGDKESAGLVIDLRPETVALVRNGVHPNDSRLVAVINKPALVVVRGQSMAPCTVYLNPTPAHPTAKIHIGVIRESDEVSLTGSFHWGHTIKRGNIAEMAIVVY